MISNNLNKRIHIAQFGTYDIESFGDSMFPKMFKYGISKFLDCDIDIFSLSESEKPYNNNTKVYSFNEFEKMNNYRNYDCAVVGGGEFIHFNSIFFKDTVYPAGYLWKIPIKKCNELKIPIIFNCVGCTYDFDKSEEKEIFEFLNKTKHVFVRDYYSLQRLKHAGLDKKKVSCIADNNWYFNQKYSKEYLTMLRDKIIKKNEYSFFLDKYIVIQYGMRKDLNILADQIKTIKRNYPENHICLMPINYCHNDYEYLNELNGYLGEECYLITEHLQPLDMMAIISGAELFIGTSLHGVLTGLSYGVRSIGIDMYPEVVGKMDGIFKMLDYEKYLIPSCKGLYATVYELFNDEKIMNNIDSNIIEIQKKLDTYFNILANNISGNKYDKFM